MSRVDRARRTNWIIAIVSLVSLVLLIALMSWLRPGVPKEVTILAGTEESRGYEWAQRYAEYFAEHGVRANVVATAGSGDILQRFQTAGGATVGFLQSGAERAIGERLAPKGLESLGSLYYEPVWLFVRADSTIGEISDLEGKRVYWGQDGSDARAAAEMVFEAYEVKHRELDPELDALTQLEAAALLGEGTIDAAVFSGAATSGEIRELLGRHGLRPASAKHAEAITRINPDMGALRIPQGLFSLKQMIPREDIEVIAPAVNLVANETLHPAIVDLFLDAATRIHRPATLLSKQGEFPSERYTSLPMNDDAARYYEKGPSGFRKYLPFWLASLVEQLIVFGLPVFVVLSTVFKGIPVYLEWKIKIDLLKFYRRLAAIEKAPKHDLEACLAELAAMEAESAKLRIPAVHLPVYFEFRQSIHDMRDRLERGW